MDKEHGEESSTKRPHHPWDEVSLPGAGTSPLDQPTILQVLNPKLNTNTEESTAIKAGPTDDNVDTTTTTTTSSSSSSSPIPDDQKQQHQQQEPQLDAPATPSDSLVSDSRSDLSQTSDESSTSQDSCSSVRVACATPSVEDTPVLGFGGRTQQRSASNTNVLDIESHLIETYDDYQANEEVSVGINELPPIQDELTVGTSKIETDANVRSVIEVEPAGVKLKKPVETLVQSVQPQIVVNGDLADSSAALTDEIRETAAKFVSEIEVDILEALSKKIAQEEAKEDKTESTTEIDTAITPSTEAAEAEAEADTVTSLSEQVDKQLSEVTSILKNSSSTNAKTDVCLNLSGVDGENLTVAIDNEGHGKSKQLKLVDVPSPQTAHEAEERKQFIESLPQIEQSDEADATKLAADCKREYYQSLKKYLIQSSAEKPPVPLQTYRWEDLKRAKERGGYPWTHLYKRPLGPDEEPEILLLLRKSQELRFASESPKSLKKVRIDDQVSIKEAERYIQELSDDEDEVEEEKQQSATGACPETQSVHSESISCVSDSVLGFDKPRKSDRFKKFRGILKRSRSGRSSEDAQSLPGTSTHNSRHQSVENLPAAQSSDQISHEPTPGPIHSNNSDTKTPRCYPIMKKLKSMADRQKKRLNIKRITLKKDEKIVLGEETKILRLKNSPKSDRSEIPHFIEKQDSDDVLEIVELDESPSRKYKDNGRDVEQEEEAKEATAAGASTSIVQPDEIIEIAQSQLEAPSESHTIEDEATAEESSTEAAATTAESPETAPPKKTPRLRREHVYEEIEDVDPTATPAAESGTFELSSVEALKQSLAKQDHSAAKEMHEGGLKPLPLDRMGSSEEEQVTASTGNALLAPISSIDSTSSDEERIRQTQLSPVAEESDAASTTDTVQLQSDEHEDLDGEAVKSSMKKEASPAPSDKKVTFSHVEDEAEPHREDIDLPEEVKEAAASKKWKHMSDHEYEPIGEPPKDEKPTITKEASPAPPVAAKQPETSVAMEIEVQRDEMKEAEELQKDLEDRYFNTEAVTVTPRPESRSDTHDNVSTSQVDLGAADEKPAAKRGFMASAQDRTRKMQAGLKNQAGKIKTKLRPSAKRSPSGSPKAKERRRFKAPEFSKMKMPEIKRPDMSKFKRPEFTKFNKPDMSKFKLPEKFSTMKLRRSKSFKENETPADDTEMAGDLPESEQATSKPPQKSKFEFNFGTYPRAFRKKKKPVEPQSSFGTETGTEGLSIVTSTATQPSIESSSSPQGDRGPGPVRSRWADKFSDVSYNDSEGSRYRRYGSEQESFDRESSLERRMKEDLEETETGSEAHDLGILGGVADDKQFAEFDEENRAIHEISNLRAGEFKRRPMVHQDSDLRSEDSKEAVGWTDKEVQKNKLLRKAELEAEASYLKYQSDDIMLPDTQSTASSGKKVVMEEIDDDEFFLRKRGVSQDNIELRQYISNAIREGYDMPINALEHVGRANEPIEYGDYDVPPPKPRRLHKSYRPEDVSQEFGSQRSDYGDDLSISQNGSDFYGGAPRRPMRKGRSRSKFSVNSEDIPMMADETMAGRHTSQPAYFDDDEEYLRPPRTNDTAMGYNDLNFEQKKKNNNNNIAYDVTDTTENRATAGEEQDEPKPQPQPPRRRKRQLRDSSMDKDSYVNGFSGRSVSNSYLQPTEDVIVYRTEHEYPIPLATPENYTDGGSAASRKSRSASKYDEDDRTSRGADSLALDNNLKLAYDEDVDEEAELQDEPLNEKFIIDIMENDGYAIVRKDLPKPTPPARRKKFSRTPGERFATLPNMRSNKHNGSPAPERPPPPRSYTPLTGEHQQPLAPQRRKSVQSLEATQNYEDDYDEPELLLRPERPESPRDLQSGEIVNKMKYRPLPPPPRPPREKRHHRGESRNSSHFDESSFDDRDGGGERIATSSTADESYEPTDDDDQTRRPLQIDEVEVSTQTDPLPDDFEVEEFEITDDMKIIEPRRPAKTLDELLQAEQEAAEQTATLLTEEEQLARGLQRFREANQRSMSERSRASSQADRSKSQSRPQTPSAIVIERRVSTPVPPSHTQKSETMLEAALIVRPIDDLDLEEEALRREGLLTDSSQQSKSDTDADADTDAERRYKDEEPEAKLAFSDYSQAPSSVELDAAIERLRSQGDSERETEREDDEEVERTMRDYNYTQQHEQEHDNEQAEGFSQHYDVDDELQKKLAAFEQKQAAYNSDEPEADQDRMFGEELSGSELAYSEEGKDDESARYERDASDSKTDSTQVEKDDEARSEVLAEEPEPAPLPPPRRKSTTAIEPTATALTIVEQQQQQQQEASTSAELTPLQTLASADATAQPQLPARMGDLEVERLRVHALQAGQIMVSQLHGKQISADELECKAGNLVVNNIELPAGLIDQIVERVRSSDRGQLLSTETQTSNEKLPTESNSLIPPPKPPRLRDLEAMSTQTEQQPSRTANADEQTQTDTTTSATMATNTVLQSPPPPELTASMIYPSAEYLQSLPPLAFYNLRRQADDAAPDADADDAQKWRRRHQHGHHHHRHHHHYRRHECSSDSEMDDDDANELQTGAADDSAMMDEQSKEQQQRRRRRTRSINQSPIPTTTTTGETQSVTQAGKQFISACSLSLVNIINQLTDSIRGGREPKDPQQQELAGATPPDVQSRIRQVPTLVVLFLLITFCLLLFLLSGRNVHTHHWDYFNPPGNEGRPSL